MKHLPSRCGNEGNSLKSAKAVALRATVALCALVLLPFGTSFAEEGGRKIEEVLVTAERKEASVQDTSIDFRKGFVSFNDCFGELRHKVTKSQSHNDKQVG